MHHNRPSHESASAHAIFTAICGSALAIGCYSDHVLGNMDPDLLEDTEAGAETGSSRQDFLVSSELGAPDLTMDADTDITRTGPADVAGVGDLDGDGFEDFVSVGNDQELSFDYLHVRYGGPRPNAFEEAFALTQGGSRLGLPGELPSIEVIVPAGDVDADGYADFLVGLGTCRPYSEREGAYLVYGDPERFESVGSLADVGVHLRRPAALRPVRSNVPGCGERRTDNYHFVGLGDFDGDGFDDVMFSEPKSFPSADVNDDRSTGGAYLFYGRAARFAHGTSWSSADARFVSEQQVTVVSVGDVNGDGLADVILGEQPDANEPTTSTWLPGRPQRLTGELTPAAAGTPFVTGRPAGDLDGDGLSDILLYDESLNPHLFYGAPGLFDAGADLSQAAATFEPYANQPRASVVAVNDRDGDGDDELVSRLFLDDHPMDSLDPFWRHEVAVLSGSSTRMSGQVTLPPPSSPYGYPRPSLELVFAAGDLDGDGAGDLVTQSSLWHMDADGGGIGQFPQLHIHYGTPGGELASPPR